MLLACSYIHDNPTSTGLTQPFTVEEIANITKSLQKRKSPGHDNLVCEHILNTLQPVNKALAMIFNVQERIPVAWKTSVVIPIYKCKEKYKTDTNRYRLISLIPVFCKVFERAISNRINSHLLTNRIPFPNPQHHGFQKGLSCITAAFNLQETIFHQIERASNAYVTFLDQKAALDSVNHECLFMKLSILGTSGKLLRILRSTYEDLTANVRICGMTSESIVVMKGRYTKWRHV